jgi:cytoskeleton protein RodZ
MNDRRTPSFGEELRRERLVRQVSLDEIARATKISRPLLRALETSDLGRLPAPVFTRGFIRAYARQLGLEPEALVNAYLADLREIEQTSASDRPRPVAGARERDRARWGWALAAVAVMLLAGAIVTIEKSRHRAAPAPIPRSAPKTVIPALPHLSVAPPPVSAQPTPAEAPEVNGESGEIRPAPPAGAGSLTLVLDFSQDCWAEVFADGHRVLAGMIRAGERRQLLAREAFRVTLGNAGGVRLSLDGRPLRPLGGQGEAVHDVRIDRAGPAGSGPPPENR